MISDSAPEASLSQRDGLAPGGTASGLAIFVIIIIFVIVVVVVPIVAVVRLAIRLVIMSFMIRPHCVSRHSRPSLATGIGFVPKLIAIRSHSAKRPACTLGTPRSRREA